MNKRLPQFLRSLNFLVGLFVLGMTFFLILRRSSDLETLKLGGGWLVERIVRWADAYGALRNLPAFFLLGVPAGLHYGWRPWRHWILGVLLWLAAFLEVVQLWLPTRVFDLMDIAWSWAGLLLGWWCAAWIRGKWRAFKAGRIEARA